MSTWIHAVTGGSWYYNSDNTNIGLPIITPDSTPSLSSYPIPPDISNIKLIWQFPETTAINFGLPYIGMVIGEPDLTNVKFKWAIKCENNYGLPHYVDVINYGAFTRCTNLESVTIPVTVKRIGCYTFQDTALESVKIPADCYIYPTSFPPNCDIIWSLKQLDWANYSVDVTTGLSDQADTTKLLCFNYIPIPEGRNIVGVIPNIELSDATANTSPLQYMVCWYRDGTYLGYDDFAPMQGTVITAQDIMEGANRLRFCIKYTSGANIEKSHLGDICQVDWVCSAGETMYAYGTSDGSAYLLSDGAYYVLNQEE